MFNVNLENPGIYRAIGPEYELLIKVIGNLPSLRIVSGIRMNDFVLKNKVVELKEESLEIQDIYTCPQKYVFVPYEVSTSAESVLRSKSIKGTHKPPITDNQFQRYIEHYIDNYLIPGRGPQSTIALMLEETDWTLSQCQIVALQIHKHLKKGTNKTIV